MNEKETLEKLLYELKATNQDLKADALQEILACAHDLGIIATEIRNKKILDEIEEETDINIQYHINSSNGNNKFLQIMRKLVGIDNKTDFVQEVGLYDLYFANRMIIIWVNTEEDLTHLLLRYS